MARSRTPGRGPHGPATPADGGSLRAARVTRSAAEPQSGPAGRIARAGGAGAQRAAALQGAGNSAVSRVVAGSSAPGPQRLWNRKEFGTKTYESFLTKKSHAQLAVEQLLDAYFALEPGPKGMPTTAHANLLAQMKASAEFWINDHSISDEEGTATDPSRPKRMAGFKEFISNIDAELNIIKPVLGDSFTEEVGEKHEAFTKLADRYKGGASALFTKAAALIDKGVAVPGDATKIEIEFELPVDPSGAGFIGGRLTIEASRDDNNMLTTRSETVVTGGAKVGVAKLKAELGGYIEASGASAADVMQLYSYGLYRRFRESNTIPSGMTNFLWGGARGDYGKKKAEAWSRDLEKRLFELVPLPDQNDPKYAQLRGQAKKKAYDEDLAIATAAQEKVKNTYVETGGIVAGKGEVGLSKVVEMTIGVQYTSGKKITAESIVAAKGAVGAQNQKGTSFGQKALGESVSAVKGSVGVKAGPFEGEVAITASGEDREIEISAGGKIPASAMGGMLAYLADIAVHSVKFYRVLKANESKTESLAPLMAFGALQWKMVGTPVAGVITKQNPMGLVGDVGVKLTATIAREDGVWDGELELSHITGGELEVAGALKIALERQSRLAKWTYSSGAWS